MFTVSEQRGFVTQYLIIFKENECFYVTLIEFSTTSEVKFELAIVSLVSRIKTEPRRVIIQKLRAISAIYQDSLGPIRYLLLSHEVLKVFLVK